MKHRHPGSYQCRTRKGLIINKRRPIHDLTARKNLQTKYQKLVNRAKAKGYKVYDLDRLQSTVDEVDIPETYRTDGLIVPDREGNKRRDLIFIDDDAKEQYKEKAFAHELGHQVLFATGQDKEDNNSNIDKIEKKADKIGADILDMSVKEFNSPDVTYKDVVSGKRNFFWDEKEEPEAKDPIDKVFTKEGKFLFPRGDEE